MDSITQAALGAAVGEALLGRKVGNKAPLWGAVLGTLPDLDALFNPLLSQSEQLSFHLGPSHSLSFALLVAPLIGAGLARLHHKYRLSWKEWSLFAFLCIFTHPLLDTLTNYGTQLFRPFTDYPAAWASIAIIDPLYTLPLLFGVVAAMILRKPERRFLWNRWGLIISTSYLLLTMGNKLYVEAVFRAELDRQGIPYERVMTSPTVLNNILWTGFAENDSAVWVGLHSLFDGGKEINFRRFAKGNDLLAGSMNEPAVRKLLWFAQGYYTVSQSGDTVIFHDMHVGRRDAFIEDEGRFIFSFRLLQDSASGRFTEFRLQEMSFDVSEETWNRFWRRIWGEVR